MLLPQKSPGLHRYYVCAVWWAHSGTVKHQGLCQTWFYPGELIGWFGTRGVHLPKKQPWTENELTRVMGGRPLHSSAQQTHLVGQELLVFHVFSCSISVGEEIEMTPMVFAKGLADSGCWGDKLFGRLVSEELRGGGHGYGLRKASQAKVIYGLEPIFESGRTCIIKVSSLLVFGPSSETSLLGRNYDVTIQVLCPLPSPSFHSVSSPPSAVWVLHLGSPVWRQRLSVSTS